MIFNEMFSNGKKITPKFMTEKDIEKNYNPTMVQEFDPAKGEDDPNIILAKDLYLSMDGHKTRHNTNVLSIGGSGSGNATNLIGPNIMQMNASFMVNDPDGRFMLLTAIPLLEHGYKVKVFSTTDTIHSNVYNPFDYLHDKNGVFDEDKVRNMANTFILNMHHNKNEDVFWNETMTTWLTFCIFFLAEFYPETDWNMYNILCLTQLGKIDEDTSSDTKDTRLDHMVMTVREQNPQAKCFTFYDTFKLAPLKTANSILITLAANLSPFSSALKDITTTSYLCKRDKNGLITEYIRDEEGKLIRDSNNIDLQSLGDQKMALFINDPAVNYTYRFLVSMMYSQMFDVCYTKAEQICPHRFNIYDSIGTAMKSGFFTKEKAERYLSLCKGAKLIERDEVDYQYKSYDGRTTVTKHPVKRYYLYNEKATDKDVQRDLYYKDPENNKGILMDVYNEQVGKLFLQKFQNASVKQGGLHLPVPLRCILYDFHVMPIIPKFNEKLATMRKYWISCTMTIQSFSGLRERNNRLIESILGNCDSIIFLGMSSDETDEYMLMKLGRIADSYLYFSDTMHKLADETDVSMIHYNKCIVFVRGYRPFYIEKYTPSDHPNYHLTGYTDETKMLTDEFSDKFYSCLPKDESDV